MASRPILALLAVACLGASWSSCPAQDKLSQAEAESRLARLKTEISSLKAGLERTRKAYADEQEALQKADLAIQANALALRELEANLAEHEEELARLHSDRLEYLQSLEQRRELLASQIMAAYRLGNESRLKLLLNQDSPALLSRMLAYYEYFSRSQVEQIKELRQVLETLNQMQIRINAELSALEEVQRSQQAMLDKMTRQRNERRLLAEQLSRRIDGEEARLAELLRNREDLEALVEKLADVLADIPADLGKRLGPAEQKGRLPMPVKGRVRSAFGHSRSGGLYWQGWLIGADGGSEVKTIAYGRVAFSDWLRGYGLLMIIDHGDGIMSLYGYNESLLRGVGDWVEPGTTISTVGANPDGGSGLYFEIRIDGKAVDPAIWLKR